MRRVFDRVLRDVQRPGVLAAIPVVFLGLLIVGAVRAYTPVPTYDMWEGALLTSFQVMAGDWREIFRFWNEHRIVLSKILFFLETRYFGARLIFLTLVNIALLVCLWLALQVAVKRLIADRDLRRIVAFGIAAFVFSWLQRENVDSPFQSQFLLAYLIPLLAFLALARSAHAPAAAGWFAGALALGAVSLGTMANGIFVFPLLFVMQAVSDLIAKKLSWGRLALIALSGAVLTILWFQGYTPTQGPPTNAGAFLAFVVTFLAFPFADAAGVFGGLLGTVILFAGVAFVARHAWRDPRTLTPDFFVPVALLAYIGATALLSAYGRASTTPNAALVGRYATPSLLAWAALAILIAAIIQKNVRARGIAATAGVLVALTLFPAQLLRTTGDRGPEFVHGNLRAALALKLDVADMNALWWTFAPPTPDAFRLLKSIADRLEAKGISFFSDPIWTRVLARLGAGAETGFRACPATIDVIEDIPGESRFVAVQGWAVAAPRFIYFAASGRIVGIAVGGGVRPDVAEITGEGRTSGFYGYALADRAEALTALCAGE